MAHEILLNRQSTRCRIGNIRLECFHFYLSGHTQTVATGSNHSTSEPLTYVVPQGSVLGPLLFSIYNCPLEK